LLLWSTSKTPKQELGEPANILASAFGGLMIKTRIVRAATAVGESGQMDVVRFGSFRNFGLPPARLPRFVCGFAHVGSIPRSEGNCDSKHPSRLLTFAPGG
jgi:hypothetical protein